MATETIYLAGKSKWSKFKTPDDKYNNWKTNLYLDDRSMKTFAESKLNLMMKQDDEGSYIVLRRPVSKVIKGNMVKFDPPELVDVNDQPTDVLVGNGSDIVCKVVVYDTIKGKGHRLEKVMIKNLVPYGGKDDASIMASLGAPSGTQGNLLDDEEEIPF